MKNKIRGVWEDFEDEGIPHDLVEELRKAYRELKENYYLGNLRPSEVEGGRFAEAALRILQWATGGLPNGNDFTPLGTPLPHFDQEVQRLEDRPGRFHKSLRVRIPRVLHSIYNIRNGRDVAHLSSDVNPNLADSTLVVSNADWVLAELVRLFHGVSLVKARSRVDGIVKRSAPVVEMFGEIPKVLRTELSYPDETLLMLYTMGDEGATAEDLADWQGRNGGHARQTLKRLDERALVHYDSNKDRGVITRLGIKEVEDEIGIDLQ
jgi:hypothetical protein